MKKILASTAIAIAMTTSAMAASTMQPLATYEAVQGSGDILASNYIGMRVYATEDQNYASWDENYRIAADGEREWDDIGEINDVILGMDGKVKAVIVGVGGFIGIGERDVALPMESIKFVNEQDDPGDFFLVVQANKEMLEQAPEYERMTREQAMEKPLEMEVDRENATVIETGAEEQNVTTTTVPIEETDATTTGSVTPVIEGETEMKDMKTPMNEGTALKPKMDGEGEVETEAATQ